LNRGLEKRYKKTHIQPIKNDQEIKTSINLQSKISIYTSIIITNIYLRFFGLFVATY